MKRYSKNITVILTELQLENLQKEAEVRGMQTAALARHLIVTALSNEAQED